MLYRSPILLYYYESWYNTTDYTFSLSLHLAEDECCGGFKRSQVFKLTDLIGYQAYNVPMCEDDSEQSI